MANLSLYPLKDPCPVMICNGIPSNSVGQDGEVREDINTGVHYFKQNGVWVSVYTPGTSKKYNGMPYIGLVATRAKVPTNGTGSVLQHMSRTIHVARVNIMSIGAAFANWYVGAPGQEYPTNGTATIQAAIEYPLGGTIYPLAFGGNNSGVAQDFTTIASDLASVSIPKGATFAIREYRVASAGGSVVYTSNVLIDTADGECYAYGSPTANLVGVPGPFTSTGTTFSRPVAVFGLTSDPSYALIGDSRVEGLGDTASGNMDIGELARSVGPLRAYTNLGCSSEQIKQIVGGTDDNLSFGFSFAQRASIIQKYCTHIISNYGVNDLFTGGVSGSTIQGYFQALRSLFPAQYFYQTIPMGETNTTDAYATVGNQTTKNTGYETNRRWAANFLRSGFASAFDGIYDTASIVESSQNSGLWKAPGYTADGVHASATAYALIASSGIIQVQ